MPLFYELNAFHFSGSQTLDLFMKAFPEKLMPHLRHLIISTKHTVISPDEAFLPLVKATNLTCVELDCWMPEQVPIERQIARRRRAIEMYGPPPPSPSPSPQQPLAAPSPGEGPRRAQQPQPDLSLQQLPPSRPQPADVTTVPSTRSTLRWPTRSNPMFIKPFQLERWPLNRMARNLCKVGGFQRWMEAIGDAKGDPRAGANVFCLSQKLMDKRLEFRARGMTPSVTMDEASEFRTLLGDMLTNLPPNLGE